MAEMNDKTITDLIVTAQGDADSMVMEALTFVEIATDFKIETAEDAAVAGEQLSAIAKFRKRADERRLEHTRPLDDAKTNIIDKYRGPLSKAEEAEKALRAALTTWTLAEQQRAREEQLRRDAALAAERDRLAKVAEAERAKAEQAKTDRGRVAAEVRSEVAEAQAAAVDLAGSMAKPASTAVKGFSLRKNWVAEPIKSDADAILEIVRRAAAAENPAMFTQFLKLDTTKIGKVAKALEDNADIPGHRVYNKPVSSVR